MEEGLPIVPRGEDPLGDQAMMKDMAIEGGAKAVDRGRGAETGTRWRAGAGPPKGRLARPQEDPKQGRNCE